jgi:hypothetical protein
VGRLYPALPNLSAAGDLINVAGAVPVTSPSPDFHHLIFLLLLPVHAPVYFGFAFAQLPQWKQNGCGSFERLLL